MGGEENPLECSWSPSTASCLEIPLSCPRPGLQELKEPQQELFPFQGFSWSCLSFGNTSEGSLLPEVMETIPQGCSTPTFPPVGLWPPSAPAKSHSAGLGKLPEGLQLPPSPSPPPAQPGWLWITAGGFLFQGINLERQSLSTRTDQGRPKSFYKLLFLTPKEAMES